MQLTVNGKKTIVEDIATVSELIEHLGMAGRIAVEINREIVPRSRFDTHRLKEDDIVEIVHAIGGG